MTRHLCWIALLGSATVPDWASACYFRQNWAPPPCVYYPPPCYNPPPVVYVPVYPAPISPPRIAPTVPQARVQPAPLPPRVQVDPDRTEAKPPAPMKPARTASDNAVVAPVPAPATPTVAPMPMIAVPEPPMFKPVDPIPAVPADPFKAKSVEPSPLKSPDGPTLTLPGAPEPAVPSPAPAPTAKDIIPPMVPRLPESAVPKPSGVSSDPLPPLVLPPEATPMGSTSKYSPPIAVPKSALQVKVFVAAGAGGRPGLSKIGFYNHTESDIALVIEGRAVTLPRKTFIHAEVPPTFRWKYADEPERTATVPAGAVGLDVLFRE